MKVEALGTTPRSLSPEGRTQIEAALKDAVLLNRGMIHIDGTFTVHNLHGRTALWVAEALEHRGAKIRLVGGGVDLYHPDLPNVAIEQIPQRYIRIHDPMSSGPVFVTDTGIALSAIAPFFHIGSEKLKQEELLAEVAKGTRSRFAGQPVGLWKITEENWWGRPIEKVGFVCPPNDIKDAVFINPANRKLIDRQLLYPFLDEAK